MDELDISQDRSELERETLLRRIMARKPDAMEPCGECHDCGELIGQGKKFCNSDCADAHARRVK